MLGFCALSAAAAIVTLAAILGYIGFKGFAALNFDFLVSLPQPVGETGGGVANAIAGTILLVGLACALGVPIGLMAGIFLAEFAERRLGI